jgi:hypothetical protein
MKTLLAILTILFLVAGTAHAAPPVGANDIANETHRKLSEKVTPANDDVILIYDSTEAGTKKGKKVKWSTIANIAGSGLTSVDDLPGDAVDDTLIDPSLINWHPPGTFDVGTAGTTLGQIRIFTNVEGNNYPFIIFPGNTGAGSGLGLGWRLPIVQPGGANWLLNVSQDGTMAYTDPSTLGGFSLAEDALSVFNNISGLGLNVQNANKIFAGPGTGADADPTFRQLVAADLPGGTNNTEFHVDAANNGPGWKHDSVGAPGVLQAVGPDGTTPAPVKAAGGEFTGPLSIGTAYRQRGAFTVATIPADPAANDVILITDGASPCDQTTGSGAFVSQFWYSGSAWTCLGAESVVVGVTKVVCTDGSGDPIACTNLTDTAIPTKASSTEINSGTDDTKFVTAYGLSASYVGTKDIGWTLFDNDTATAIGDGKKAYAVPASLNGMNLVDVTCSVADLNSAVSGATTVVLRRCRGATCADMTSTGVTIDYNAYTASDETVDTSNDDLATGDNLYFDVNAITTPAQKGLSCTALFRLP